MCFSLQRLWRFQACNFGIVGLAVRDCRLLRFGAIRTLNMLAHHRPQLAARCNCDMEPLLSDSNRNTATLALTTLLKTGHESNVERLVKQITSFMSDISDVFKIEVVRAVKALCLQYPSKYKTLMGSLLSMSTSQRKFSLPCAISFEPPWKEKTVIL